jgi:hypothetical protein
MARLRARSSGRNVPLVDPSREFEDIDDRMGQLVNVALGDLGTAWLAELPWSPSAEGSETENKCRRHRSAPRTGRFECRAMLPGDAKPAARPREIEVSDN